MKNLAGVCVATLLAALVLASGGAVSAHDADRHALALDLARVGTTTTPP